LDKRSVAHEKSWWSHENDDETIGGAWRRNGMWYWQWDLVRLDEV
jgi:hypothetical protein